jgi:hypothetical protein
MTTRMTILALALVACDPKSVGSTATAGVAEDSGFGSGLGAPCDHEHPTRVETKLLTYPHADCNGGICLYADDSVVAPEACDADADCGPTPSRAECIPSSEDDSGVCALDQSYVASRSMCSQVCESNADCTTQENTACKAGFVCARVAALGDLCCQRVCVCDDDLGFTEELDAACASSTAQGCCIDAQGNPIDPPPPGCGVP